MHIAAVFEIHDTLLPAVDRMRLTLEEKSREFSQIIKIGRTHLQDATPADTWPGNQWMGSHDPKQSGADFAVPGNTLSLGHLAAQRWGQD